MITSSTLFGHDVEDPDAPLEDPEALLDAWLPQPVDELRPLMALTTLDEDGWPDTRHVLLSAHAPGALLFHTDARTRKAAHLAADPRVSLALVWPDLGRQVTVQGEAEPTEAEAAAAVFAARSRYLQLLAWQNDADAAALPRAARRQRWAEFAAAHPEALDAPATWVGYRVTPRRITFWRGDPDGPSHRLACARTPTGWTVTRLPG
ncbi:pyridoxamine 5'-phosphate oxidase family protein [Cellulomonas marina]|uniref:Pyridoxamine 5'-phosphate oxidase n=1 Tax=Cellulomonas marina TaxID=988821 RepID=A0A1I0V7R7_9CELL|nr:pyridoxamine 5'-phosphate oxidase family protein [Cellulomonas marina]GIG29231.1 pyridoxine/pyridoxamine 5'-phosphate oxidase [Cellulomonas marina]SFA72434.1 pyridoxamine 5'-phosphate oxidase [Cellulomonas marina]